MPSRSAACAIQSESSTAGCRAHRNKPQSGIRSSMPAGAFELVRNPRAPRVEAVANACDVLAEMAADEHLVNHALGERRRRHRHEQLHPRQRGDRVGIRDDEAHAQARGQRLAVAAEVERTLEPVERREPGGALPAKSEKMSSSTT